MHLIDDYQTIVLHFEAVLAALDKICGHIQSQLKDYPIWVDNGKGVFISDRQKVVNALCYFKSAPGASPQETYSCPGAIGATKQTASLIKQVNQAKDQFKAIVQDFLPKQPANPYPTRIIHRVLALNGYSNVRLKHVYRHFVFIDYHPRRLAWTRSKSGSYKVIKPGAARKLLAKVGEGKHIAIQLAKLNQLKPSEKLVIYRPIKPLWEVNIASPKKRERHSTMQKVRCALPVFYLHHEKLSTPEVCFSSKANRNAKTHRLDKKIQDKPFLNSIHAYRYVV